MEALEIKMASPIGVSVEATNKTHDEIRITESGLIVNGIDGLMLLMRNAHPKAFVHVEVVGRSKRDYRRVSVERLAGWRYADAFDGVPDVFTSINPIYDPRGKREIANISQVLWVWVDIDNQDGGEDWVYQTAISLDSEVFGKVLPEPSAVVSSGRGIWALWAIDPISPRNKISMKLWRAVMGKFTDILQPYGADKGVTDISRLMRVAGSINSKSGQVVTIQERHRRVYDITGLHGEYCPKPKRSGKTKTTGKPTKAQERPAKATGKVHRYHTPHSLVWSRANDLEKLVALRGGDVNGVRNKLLYIYATTVIPYHHENEEKAAQRVVELNEILDEPLSASEVTTIINSAARQGRFWKNETIIRWLGITPEEQTQLETIIGEDEKLRRHRERMRATRGGTSREEYQAKIAREREDKLADLRRAMEENPGLSNVKLAGILGWSEGTIRNLKKLL